MVKLKGPAMAATAGGQLAGQLIFSNWKGRAYLKKHAAPRQPQAEGQVAMRAMMSFLSGAWSGFSAETQKTWQDLAHQTAISPFNAYQAENLRRWRSHKGPSCRYPATEDDQPTVWADNEVLGHGNHAHLRFKASTKNDGWNIIWFRTTEATGPSRWDQMIHAQPIIPHAWNEWIFYPAVSGTYRFAWQTSTVSGLLYMAAPYYFATATLTV